jgi:hypothetical protein
MTEYRPGGCWKRTLVKVGTQPPDEQGRRPDDELVGMVDDPELAERICALLNGEVRSLNPYWCHGSPTLAGAVCGRNAPHGPHDRCARADCDHWHCNGQPS